jgi:hypothetical protein
MNQGVEGRHEEVPSRHPLAPLSFGAILTFVGARARRGSIAAGCSATPVVEQAPAVADRQGIFSLLTAEGVGAGRQHDPSELTVR